MEGVSGASEGHRETVSDFNKGESGGLSSLETLCVRKTPKNREPDFAEFWMKIEISTSGSITHPLSKEALHRPQVLGTIHSWRRATIGSNCVAFHAG